MRNYLRYGFMILIIILLWDTILIQPLKVFALYIHQFGHLLMSLIFSYKPGTDIDIRLTETFYKIIHKKSAVSAFLIGNAGYLFGMIFSFFVIYLKETPLKKYVPGIFALFFIWIASAFSSVSSQLLYASIFAGLAVILHMLHRDSAYEWIIEVISMSNIAYILNDIGVNTVYYELNIHFKFVPWGDYNRYTDAIQLETLTGVPPIAWGIIWLILIFIACYVFLDVANVPDAPVEETK